MTARRSTTIATNTVPLPEAETAMFRRCLPKWEWVASLRDRETALQHVLESDEFLRAADKAAVHKALAEAGAALYYVETEHRGIQETRSEAKAWKRENERAYDLLRAAYVALLRLFKDGNGNRPLVPRGRPAHPAWTVDNLHGEARHRALQAGPGRTLRNAAQFLQSAIAEYPALALDFPDATGATSIQGQRGGHLARLQKKTKDALLAARVSHENVSHLLFAMGLLKKAPLR